MKIEFTASGTNLTVGELMDALMLYNRDERIVMADNDQGWTPIELIRHLNDNGERKVLIG